MKPRYVRLLDCSPSLLGTTFLVLSWDSEGFHIHGDGVCYLLYENQDVSWSLAPEP
jgi:hypothetical protein